MKQRNDEAFVLGTRELGDSDLIVTLLTPHHGRARAVAASARRSRRRFGGLLEPLTHLRASWVEREGRDLHRLERVELCRSFAALQADPLRLSVCAAFAELADAYAVEDQADPDGFRLVRSVMVALDEGGDPLALLRYFEAWMLRLHGLFPELDRCEGCGEPIGGDLGGVDVEGRLRCARCRAAGDRSLDREVLGFVERTRRVAPSEIGAAPAAARSGRALERLLRGALERFAERRFRSYRHVAAAAAVVGEDRG